MGWRNPNWKALPFHRFYTIGLTWRKNHLEQQLRKSYLLKLLPRDLAKVFAQVFQTHFAINQVNDIKQQNYIFLQSEFPN